jgi:DNA-binding CsgD family transcriptional regulator
MRIALRARDHARTEIDADPDGKLAAKVVQSLAGAADPRRPKLAVRRTLSDGIALELVVEEISARDTAKFLGIREETVNTRLHRARRLLRDILGDQFASMLKDVFPFERPRCDALVRRTLKQVGIPDTPELAQHRLPL